MEGFGFGAILGSHKRTITKCGYKDADLRQFRADLRSLGSSAFLASVPTVTPRAKASFTRFVNAFVEMGVTAPAPGSIACTVEGQGNSGQSGSPKMDGVFLGQMLAAAVRQDAKAVASLTAQVDPTDELRK